jgi:hypothetical protein
LRRWLSRSFADEQESTTSHEQSVFWRMNVKFLIFVIAWFILLAVSWPLAIVALVLLPFVWLIALPFRVVGICVSAVLALVKALLFLPARILGYRGS